MTREERRERGVRLCVGEGGKEGSRRKERSMRERKKGVRKMEGSKMEERCKKEGKRGWE